MLAAVAAPSVLAAARILPGFLTIDTPPSLSDGAPNLWAIARMLPWLGDLPLAGLAMATALGAAAWLVAHLSAHPPRGDRLLPAALLVTLALPGLLPAMQPSDFVLAVWLSVMLGIRERTIAPAALVIGGWLLAIFMSAPLGAAPIMVATLLTARPFFASPANDNGLPLNPVGAYPA